MKELIYLMEEIPYEMLQPFGLLKKSMEIEHNTYQPVENGKGNLK